MAMINDDIFQQALKRINDELPKLKKAAPATIKNIKQQMTGLPLSEKQLSALNEIIDEGTKAVRTGARSTIAQADAGLAKSGLGNNKTLKSALSGIADEAGTKAKDAGRSFSDMLNRAKTSPDLAKKYVDGQVISQKGRNLVDNMFKTGKSLVKTGGELSTSVADRAKSIIGELDDSLTKLTGPAKKVAEEAIETTGKVMDETGSALMKVGSEVGETGITKTISSLAKKAPYVGAGIDLVVSLARGDSLAESMTKAGAGYLSGIAGFAIAAAVGAPVIAGLTMAIGLGLGGNYIIDELWPDGGENKELALSLQEEIKSKAKLIDKEVMDSEGSKPRKKRESIVDISDELRQLQEIIDNAGKWNE